MEDEKVIKDKIDKIDYNTTNNFNTIIRNFDHLNYCQFRYLRRDIRIIMILSWINLSVLVFHVRIQEFVIRTVLRLFGN